MKTATAKKLFAFIILVFSISLANAQCYCECFNQQRINAICVSNANNGNTHCKHVGPRFCGRTADPSFIANETSLDDVYPNPVMATATVFFYVAQAEHVNLSVLDVSGRLVSTLADATFEEGDFEITWNAAEVNAGIYFLQFNSGEYLKTEKLIVSK